MTDTAEDLKLSDPRTLVTEAAVKDAIFKDLGKEVRLLSWKVVDFTNKGDNYASFVTSIEAIIDDSGESKTLTYIAKLNPLRFSSESDKPALQKMTNDMFLHEGKFFLDIAPALSELLLRQGLPAINVPKCYYSDYTVDKEILICEDLRKRGFKMFDRRKGMDFPHAVLVLQELAKLHAISCIYSNEKQSELLSLFPFLVDIFSNPEMEEFKTFQALLQGIIDSGINLLGLTKNHDKSVAYLKYAKEHAKDIFRKQSAPTKGCFLSINHGDCWNNNVLFKYDEEGKIPLQVMLVDLQITRVAGLGLDLNYLLYTSLTGEIRSRFKEELLRSYYKKFQETRASFGLAMEFTFEDLLEEYKSKHALGCLLGMLAVSIVLTDPEDAIDFGAMGDENIDEFVQDMQARQKKMMTSNPNFKCRYLAIFDELVESGLLAPC